MSAVVVDTHTIIWYLLKTASLSQNALTALRNAVHNNQPIYVASISLVEVTYLVERGRLPMTALERLRDEIADPNVNIEVTPLDLNISMAIQRVPRSLVPEMPDRIITATALYLSLPLVTRDLRIQGSGIPTIW